MAWLVWEAWALRETASQRRFSGFSLSPWKWVKWKLSRLWNTYSWDIPWLDEMRQQYNANVNSKQMGKITIEKGCWLWPDCKRFLLMGKQNTPHWKRSLGGSGHYKKKAKKLHTLLPEGRQKIMIAGRNKRAFWVTGKILFLDWDSGYKVCTLWRIRQALFLKSVYFYVHMLP